MRILLAISIPLFWWGCKSEKKADTLFTQRSADETGVTFSNQLPEDKDFNIIQYLYYYNGGGVSIGDINNDGLPDLYFSSNRGDNKLYLNKGNFHFEDITGKAGVAGKGNWKTGVTMADVNGDGLLDIYLCVVGNYKKFSGRNQLFINNGNLTFTESAAKYGLDKQCFSTQAAFFDYDRDGDLDMFLLCHSVHSPDVYRDTSQRREPDAMSGDKMFRNDGSVFKDMTDSAGIYQGKAGYGLGVAIGDVNHDGWPDIYVGNDFHENDYLYYNNGNGTFSEKITQSMGHTSMFSMGDDMADFNNDGLLDIVTLDMKPEEETLLKRSALNDPYDIYEMKLGRGYHYQYSRNALQLNRGNLSGNVACFSEIAQLAGVSATDWSWSALLADFDNDGWKDLYISNGILRRPIDLDYLKFVSSPKIQSSATDLDIAAQMPSGKATHYLYQNKGDLTFQNVAEAWGLNQQSWSNGASYADLDNDGDLDLVVNNLNEPAYLLQNHTESKTQNRYLRVKLEGMGGNRFGVGAKVTLYKNGTKYFQELSASRGFQSAVEQVLTFGVGKAITLDSVRVVWPDGKRQTLYKMSSNQMLVFQQKNAAFVTPPIEKPVDVKKTIAKVNMPKAKGKTGKAMAKKGKTPVPKAKKSKTAQPSGKIFNELTHEVMLTYKHQENRYYDNNREKLIPRFESSEGPRIAVADVNGDGLDDFYIGGARGQAGQLYLQSKNGLLADARVVKFEKDKDFEDIDVAFVDVDGDKDKDLYVVSGGNEESGTSSFKQDRLYLNDGKGNFTRSKDGLPVFYHNGSCVTPGDFDGDGDVDLFVGSRSEAGAYGISPRSYLLQNDGKGHFRDVTDSLATDLMRVGMVTDAVWADMTGDKVYDLVVVGEWMPITIFKYNGKKFEKRTLQHSEGWWNCIVAADMDKDGDDDLLVGNLGLNSNLQASSIQPVSLYVKDFDGNGSTDPLLTYYRQDKEYLYVSKDELASQLPSWKKKFPEYAAYANSTFSQVFSAADLKDAVHLEVNQFASVYIENRGNGELELRKLPVTAQFSPVESILTGDFDQDGQMDAILGNNFYEVQPSIGRFDAGYGVFLDGDGKGNFATPEPGESGLILLGQVRDLKWFRTAFGGRFILAARNNDSIQVFQAVSHE